MPLSLLAFRLPLRLDRDNAVCQASGAGHRPFAVAGYLPAAPRRLPGRVGTGRVVAPGSRAPGAWAAGTWGRAWVGFAAALFIAAEPPPPPLCRHLFRPGVFAGIIAASRITVGKLPAFITPLISARQPLCSRPLPPPPQAFAAAALLVRRRVTLLAAALLNAAGSLRRAGSGRFSWPGRRIDLTWQTHRVRHRCSA